MWTIKLPLSEKKYGSLQKWNVTVQYISTYRDS